MIPVSRHHRRIFSSSRMILVGDTIEGYFAFKGGPCGRHHRRTLAIDLGFYHNPCWSKPLSIDLLQFKGDSRRRKPLSFLQVLTSWAPLSSPIRRDTKGGCSLRALHYFLIWQSGSGPSTKPEGRRKQCG